MEVEAEFEDLSAQLFEAQQRVHEQAQSLTESEAKRCAHRAVSLASVAWLNEVLFPWWLGRFVSERPVLHGLSLPEQQCPPS